MKNPSSEKPQREVENLIGWRKMKILPVGMLVSPYREGGMTSVLSEEAVCDQRPNHDAPEGDCTPGCGWYAFYAANDIYGGSSRWSEPFKADEAIVEVSAVGKTWLHDKGFRTKQIRMESIWVPKGTDPGLSGTLGEMYDIPVYEIPGQKEMEDASATNETLREIRAAAGTDWAKQLGDFKWKSESGKSSSQPSPQSEPSGKSPLTLGREIQKFWEEVNNLRHGRPSPSQYGSRQVREQVEADLAMARDVLNRASGKCALCSKTEAHTHDINDLKGESGG